MGGRGRTFENPTDRQREYLNDLAVRAGQPISVLMEQYGTYTRIGSTPRLSRRDASRLITLLVERLGKEPGSSRRRPAPHSATPHRHAHAAAFGRR